MKNNRFFITLSILTVALASLACTMFVGGPAYPETPIAISTEAAGSLDQQLEAAQTAAAQNGTLTLTINETQITSLLAAKLDSQSDPFIREPQVYLRDGEIQVYGKVTQGNLQANVRIVLSAAIDADGKPKLTVASANFGPLPAPSGLNDTISAFIEEAFTGSLGPAAVGLRVDSITIADGTMTLTGQVK
ncbi:MAG: hypothetical protein NT121_25865 [Chloroflexi bacterium]|nr:hypothetical protein [Chloroflexota bacterium]